MLAWASAEQLVAALAPEQLSTYFVMRALEVLQHDDIIDFILAKETM